MFTLIFLFVFSLGGRFQRFLGRLLLDRNMSGVAFALFLLFFLFLDGRFNRFLGRFPILPRLNCSGILCLIDICLWESEETDALCPHVAIGTTMAAGPLLRDREPHGFDVG